VPMEEGSFPGIAARVFSWSGGKPVKGLAFFLLWTFENKIQHSPSMTCPTDIPPQRQRGPFSSSAASLPLGPPRSRSRKPLPQQGYGCRLQAATRGFLEAHPALSRRPCIRIVDLFSRELSNRIVLSSTPPRLLHFLFTHNAAPLSFRLSSLKRIDIFLPSRASRALPWNQVASTPVFPFPALFAPSSLLNAGNGTSPSPRDVNNDCPSACSH